jgi:hypothetical protein
MFNGFYVRRQELREVQPTQLRGNITDCSAMLLHCDSGASWDLNFLTFFVNKEE